MLANLPGAAYRCLNDRSWTMQYISEGLRDLSGYEAADILGNARLSYADLLHPEDSERVWDEIQQALSCRQAYQVEYRLVKPDGSVAWVWEQGRGVYDGDGRVLFLEGIIIDVNARARSREQLRGVLDATPFPVALVDTNDDVIEYWSKSAHLLFGHTAPTAREWYELAYPDPEYRREVIQRWRPAVERARSSPGISVNAGEYRVACADGSTRDCELHAAFVGGWLVVTFNDVTGRNQADEAAQASGRLFEGLFTQAGDAIYLLEQKTGRVIDCNREAAGQLGYDREEILGRPVTEIECGLTAQQVEELHAGLQPESVTTVEGLHRRRDGSTFPVEIRLRAFAGTGPPMLLAVVRDVSERRLAAEQLRASEERFRTLVEESPIAMWVQTGGKLRYANQAARLLFGESVAAPLVGRTVLELIHPDFHDSVNERIKTVLKRQPVPPIRLAVLTLDGRRVEVDSTAAPFTYDGEDGSLVFIIDITERLKTEEALRLTQYSIDNVADAVFWSDSDARIIYASESLCRSVGYDRGELLDGMTIFDLDPTLTPDTWRETWTGMQQRGTLVFETLHRDKSGRCFPVEVAANSVTFGDREYNCAVARDISERKKAEDEAARRNQIFEQSQNEIYVFEAETLRLMEVNRTARENLGYSMKELLGMTLLDLKPAYTADSFRRLVDPLRKGRVRKLMFTSEHRRKDGTLYPVEVHLRLYAGGSRPLFVATVLDITDRVQAEEELRRRDEQLQQAQKMEAIGRLAGGVAHDFNNLLTAVLGYSDLLLAGDLSDPDDIREDLLEIKKAALRAKELTSQILAFSRRQPRQPRVVLVNDLVHESAPLLLRTLGEDIELIYRLGPGAGAIEVDPGQFTQVLVNLAVNARDAMPGGGRLVVETSSAGQEGSPWMQMTVADTGHGMDAETLGRVFEPFFTTKKPGEGTGLGLATVYGIVAQSGGKISVSSEPGAGTVFTVMLPNVESDVGRLPSLDTAPPRPLPTGAEGRATILLVEDEAAVRGLAARVLSEQGYQVLTAPDGSQAVALARDHRLKIDMLLTDVVLPGELQGDEVARLVLQERPGIACLFMSGYPRDVIAKSGRLAEGVNYLEKPFAPAALVGRVREVIDAA